MTSKKNTPAPVVVKSTATKTKQEIERLERRIDGMTMTAENAAEHGETEHYIDLCKEITKLELQKEILQRKYRLEMESLTVGQQTQLTLISQ